jgi:nitroreductase
MAIDPLEVRTPAYPVSEWFLKRWSPRAMSGESLSDEELMPLFEAARWAPSSMNNQHWRFVYARRDTPAWSGFLDLLVEGNRLWCERAAVLVIVLSKRTFDRNGKPAATHSFDTGAAWMSLALQGSESGLVVHGMGGFDYEGARRLLDLDDEYAVEAMAAIGKPGDPGLLPEKLREREAPSSRRPLGEIVFEGSFTPEG